MLAPTGVALVAYFCWREKSKHGEVMGKITAGALVGLFCLSTLLFAQPVDGYSSFAELKSAIATLEKSPHVSVTVLAKSQSGREVYAMTVGGPNADSRPAILVMGNVYGPHLVGSELCLRLAQALTKAAEEDPSILESNTFYFIPRPTPDASEAFFRAPYQERAGNERSLDDDRDAARDEDPAEDLNGDGWITMMRVADETGDWIVHPDDPRIMIKADRKKGEQGAFALYIEGTDSDSDEQWNEDGPGGVDFNRNFGFKYPFFEEGAGPHQVSEAETRAVADFCYDHKNIAAVFSFSPDDNLFHPWKANKQAEGKKVKTTLLTGDNDYQDPIAEKYREIHGGKKPVDAMRGSGSFSDWVYFHFGRWSFAARGWWIPEVKNEASEDSEPEEKKEAQEQPDDDAGAEEKPKEGAGDKTPERKKDKKKDEDKRGAEDREALTWFEAESIDGFAPWTAYDHPDFPGKAVEIGGFRPFLRLNPPATELESLTGKHLEFLNYLVQQLPALAIADATSESLGGNLHRITVTVVNRGFLPTMSRMGEISRQHQRLQVELSLPEGAGILDGVPRRDVGVLAGKGGHKEISWVVNAPAGTAFSLRAWSPAVGDVTGTVTVGGE
jgi:hypothetical protein